MLPRRLAQGPAQAVVEQLPRDAVAGAAVELPREVRGLLARDVRERRRVEDAGDRRGRRQVRGARHDGGGLRGRPRPRRAAEEAARERAPRGRRTRPPARRGRRRRPRRRAGRPGAADEQRVARAGRRREHEVVEPQEGAVARLEDVRRRVDAPSFSQRRPDLARGHVLLQRELQARAADHVDVDYSSSHRRAPESSSPAAGSTKPTLLNMLLKGMRARPRGGLQEGRGLRLRSGAGRRLIPYAPCLARWNAASAARARAQVAEPRTGAGST